MEGLEKKFNLLIVTESETLNFEENKIKDGLVKVFNPEYVDTLLLSKLSEYRNNTVFESDYIGIFYFDWDDQMSPLKVSDTLFTLKSAFPFAVKGYLRFTNNSSVFRKKSVSANIEREFDIVRFAEELKKAELTHIHDTKRKARKIFLRTNEANRLSFRIKMPSELQMAFKQYLIFFSQYVSISKGVKIEFEVITVKNGLEIQLENDQNLHLIKIYLNEYIELIFTDVDNLDIDFDAKSEFQKDLLIIKLKQQIRHLKTQLEIERVENKESLREHANDLKMILLAQSNKKEENHYHQNFHSNQEVSNTLTLNNELTIKIGTLIKLIEEIEDQSNRKIPELRDIKKHLKQAEQTKSSSDREMFLKRAIKNLNSIKKVGSAANSILEHTKNGLEKLNNLGQELGSLIETTGF